MPNIEALLRYDFVGLAKKYTFNIDLVFLNKLNVYNFMANNSFDSLRVYAVGCFVTKFKYNNAWMDNKLTEAEFITLHVILSLIATR